MPEPIDRPSAQMPAKSTHPAIVLLRLSMLAAPFAGARSSERLIDLALPYWGTRGGARDERPIGAVEPDAWPPYTPRSISDRRTWGVLRLRHRDRKIDSKKRGATIHGTR